MGMDRGSVALAFLVSLMAIFGACSADAVYRVGDSAGWTDNGSVVYNNWAKTFHVGDTIVFEYNARFHNVKQVTHHDFQSCNVTTSPKVTYSSGGGDSITLKRPTHLYFACGFPGHCQAGQKVDIRVLKSFLGPTGSPSTSSLSHQAHKTSAATFIGLYFSFSLGSLLLVALGLLMVWLLTGGIYFHFFLI